MQVCALKLLGVGSVVRGCGAKWLAAAGMRWHLIGFDMYVDALLLSGDGAVVREDGAELLAAIGVFLCTCVV